MHTYMQSVRQPRQRTLGLIMQGARELELARLGNLHGGAHCGLLYQMDQMDKMRRGERWTRPCAVIFSSRAHVWRPDGSLRLAMHAGHLPYVYVAWVLTPWIYLDSAGHQMVPPTPPRREAHCRRRATVPGQWFEWR